MVSLKTNNKNRYSRTRDFNNFHFTHSLPFQNLGPTLPTMQQQLNDITGGNLPDYMQLPLEPQKGVR